MMNFYAALGFNRIIEDTATLRKALEGPSIDASLKKRIQYVLFHSGRKQHYDWVLRSTQDLALYRLKFGLGKCPFSPPLLPGFLSTQEPIHPAAPGISWILPGVLLSLLMVAGTIWKFVHTPLNPTPQPGHSRTTAQGESTEGKTVPDETPPMGSPPDHGWIQADPSFIPAVPWHIHTKAGQNYLLNLVETKSQRVVLTLFLHGGEPYYGRAPEGEFEVAYTYGHHWYGMQQAFGVDSRRVRLAQIQSITAGPDDSWIWELNLGTTSGTASPVSPVDSFSVSEPQE